MLFFSATLKGLEDFENKIDKLAENEGEEDDDSWVGRLYREYKENEDNGDQDEEDVGRDDEGLEAPALDTVGADQGEVIHG